MISIAQKYDIEEIAVLEKEYIECPWSENMLEAAFENGYIFLTFKENGILKGYCFFKIILDEAEFCNIAVKYECHHSGVAAALMEQTHEYCKNAACGKIFLEVNEKNHPAIKLYEKYGYEKIRLRKNYYKSGDAIIMMKNL